MHNILNGVKNFLMLVENNWTTIVVCLSVIFLIYKRAVAFFSKSEREQIAFAKDVIAKTMLSYVSEAEKGYTEWVNAGAAKRAEVIAAIYGNYPILEKVADQEALIAWIDNVIDDALEEMRKMIINKTERT